MPLMVLRKINQPRQTEKTVRISLMNYGVVYRKKWMWMKEILGRAIEDEILSKPLRQRFKLRLMGLIEKRLHLIIQFLWDFVFW